MKVRHSHSLLLVWRLAEIEARHLHASAIEPAHLLLGLCKAVDIDLAAVVSKDSPDRDEVLEELLREVRRLRTVFRAAGLNACSFRRAFRRLLTRDADSSEGRHLRRTTEAKQMFADAEHLAAIANTNVYPVHLLTAITSTADTTRGDLLDQLGVEAKRLQKAANREVLPAPRGVEPPFGRN